MLFGAAVMLGCRGIGYAMVRFALWLFDQEEPAHRCNCQRPPNASVPPSGRDKTQRYSSRERWSVRNPRRRYPSGRLPPG
jgi:hypothetical protein